MQVEQMIAAGVVMPASTSPPVTGTSSAVLVPKLGEGVHGCRLPAVESFEKGRFHRLTPAFASAVADAQRLCEEVFLRVDDVHQIAERLGRVFAEADVAHRRDREGEVARAGEVVRLDAGDDVIADLHEDMAAEQKARKTYDNILRLVDDPDVKDVIRFLRQREIVHFQRFGEALDYAVEQMDSRNVYAFNPGLRTPGTAR